MTITQHEQTNIAIANIARTALFMEISRFEILHRHTAFGSKYGYLHAIEWSCEIPSGSGLHLHPARFRRTSEGLPFCYLLFCYLLL
jgi:hypothetical protein